MIYVIDHKDSFTHNVVHQLSLFDKVECADFDEIDYSKLKKASIIVLSPGPGAPKDYPKTNKIYKEFKGKKKIIGITSDFMSKNEMNELIHFVKSKIEKKELY